MVCPSLPPPTNSLPRVLQSDGYFGSFIQTKLSRYDGDDERENVRPSNTWAIE